MESNWNQIGDESRWKHISEIGTELKYEYGRWRIFKNGRELAQIVYPRCPFSWAEDIIRLNRDLWGER